MWTHFSHEADMGVRGMGSSEEEAFEEAAMALVALTTEPSEVSLEQELTLTCEAPDHEQLLVEFLDAVVYEMATRHLVFGRFRVTIRDECLEASAWGEPRNDSRHTVGVEVKGATFTELLVARDDEGRWVAQCVVDV
jgi:SHS2 domain-containing protein